jgi:hypothetical protein
MEHKDERDEMLEWERKVMRQCRNEFPVSKPCLKIWPNKKSIGVEKLWPGILNRGGYVMCEWVSEPSTHMLPGGMRTRALLRERNYGGSLLLKLRKKEGSTDLEVRVFDWHHVPKALGGGLGKYSMGGNEQ